MKPQIITTFAYSCVDYVTATHTFSVKVDKLAKQ